MKHLKNFENNKNDINDTIELLRDTLSENPLHTDNDFYMFIGRDNFVEQKDGTYKKSIEIENMVKITADSSSVTAMNMLPLRARLQADGSKVYHIWLPKDLEDDVSGKSSNMMDEWLVEIINKNKMTGSDEHGRKTLNDVKSRRASANKYNL